MSRFKRATFAPEPVVKDDTVISSEAKLVQVGYITELHVNGTVTYFTSSEKAQKAFDALK